MKSSLFAFFLTVSASFSSFGETPFAGSWAFELPDGNPAWLAVDSETEGKLLWSVGSAKPVQNLTIAGQTLSFERKLKWKPFGKADEQWLVQGPFVGEIVEPGVLELTVEHFLDANPETRETLRLRGKQMPPLPARPDLAKVKFGKPIALFNGKDLSGWKLSNPEKQNGWRAEDGILVNETPKTDFGAYGDFGNLVTEQLFEDFRLSIDYNVPSGGNSGIYLRGMYEAQVVDRDSRMQGIQGPGAIFGRIAPSENAANPGDAWNRYVLTLVDRHITVELNGNTVIDNQPLEGCTGGGLSADDTAPGPIFLQGDHTSVRYRNLMLEPVLHSAPKAATKPNVLLLFADDLGFETLGCYGGLDFKTPHLDRLASEGMRFDRAYTSPVCTPSRMSLYTGTYVMRHGYYNVLPVHVGSKKAVDFKKRFTTYAQLLRGSGYATSVTGKWQLAALEFHPEHCRDAGFDSWCVWQIWKDGAKTTRYWDPCLNHDGQIRDDIVDRFGPDVLADYVIEQMKSAASSGQPFCIQHNMMLPHVPIIETPADKAKGKPGSLRSMIETMDAICGRIIGAVDELGLAESTYVIFMGDNGTDSSTPRRTRDGKIAGGKRDLTEAGTHIPLIVRRPGTVAPGSVAEDLIDMADWLPTLSELTDTELPTSLEIDGISFAGRLLNEPSKRQWITAGIGNHAKVFDGKTWSDWKEPAP